MAYKRISPQPVVEGGSGASTLTGVLIGNGTSAFTGNAVTQHDVLVGGASNAITSVAPSSTSGVALISQGASSDPAFGTVVVAGGGTGDTSFTAYAPIVGGTTTTGALQQATTGLSTSGLPLLTNGSSAVPSFAALSASNVNGSTSGSAPASGVIGQQISNTGTVASVSNNTATNITSITLSAGVWDITGMAIFGGGITGTTFRIGINSVSATMPGSEGINQISTPTAPTAASDSGLTICPQRFSISGSTTYYLVCYSLFTVGTLAAQGIITATRVG